LNTVLDDNKILTLANAERIPMADSTKMTFEVEDLRNASPATVSRNGIVYVSDTDLYWEPLFDTWIADRAGKSEQISQCNPEEKDWTKKFVKKYFQHKSFDAPNAVNPKQKSVFNFIRKNFKYEMETPEVVRVTQMINLMTACTAEYSVVNEPVSQDLFEKIFCYCFTWAIGGLFETPDRVKFQKEILERVGAALPQISQQKQAQEKETVFDYFVNPQTKTWEQWKPKEWKVPEKLVFSRLLIPTGDSTRIEYIIDKMAGLNEIRSEQRKETGLLNTLLLGGPGTAKTSIVMMNSYDIDTEKTTFKRINFSFYTLPHNFQESIESDIERKNAKNFRPLNGKKLCVFLDDMSMPAVNEWGDQITLEITRQLIDQRGFYYLDKDERGNFKNITGLNYLGAMNHPGGGRNDIPNRLKRLFFSVNVPPPSSKAVEGIYGRILAELLPAKKYKEQNEMISLIVESTLEMWEKTKNKLLPTPTKFHYIFTIRELARVFGGIARVAQQGSTKDKVLLNCSNFKSSNKPEQKVFLIGLWRHECQRTFVDKLSNLEDKKIYCDILDNVTKTKFENWDVE